QVCRAEGLVVEKLVVETLIVEKLVVRKERVLTIAAAGRVLIVLLASSLVPSSLRAQPRRTEDPASNRTAHWRSTNRIAHWRSQNEQREKAVAKDTQASSDSKAKTSSNKSDAETAPESQQRARRVLKDASTDTQDSSGNSSKGLVRITDR